MIIFVTIVSRMKCHVLFYTIFVEYRETCNEEKGLGQDSNANIQISGLKSQYLFMLMLMLMLMQSRYYLARHSSQYKKEDVTCLDYPPLARRITRFPPK